MSSSLARAWRLLAAAGVAEVALGVANRMAYFSILLGLITVGAAALALRKRPVAWPAWAMAVLGSLFAFRLFVYQAPLLASVLVAVSAALYVAALVVALVARRDRPAPADAAPAPALAADAVSWDDLGRDGPPR